MLALACPDVRMHEVCGHGDGDPIAHHVLNGGHSALLVQLQQLSCAASHRVSLQS